jgi:anaerobic selenocysteine-containing dehydrogenase
MMQLSRRQFLKASAGTVAVAAVADKALALTALQPVIEVDNPLGEYPDRSWERVYHDQYRYDSSFTWCCSPNDTHACRIRAERVFPSRSIRRNTLPSSDSSPRSRLSRTPASSRYRCTARRT